MIRQLKSLVLPFVVVLMVPFVLLFNFRTGMVKVAQPLPIAQLILGSLLGTVGLSLLAATISLFIRQGRGTLAPWDSTARHSKAYAFGGAQEHRRLPVAVLNGAVYIFNSFTWSVQERGRIIGRG